MKHQVIFLFLVMISGACETNKTAPTPPMGWNSYDCYGYGVNETQVKENADYIASNLKKYGWEYVVVDFLWSLPDVGPVMQNIQIYQNDQFLPRLNMDKYGRLLPDTARFPSSTGDKGFLPLANYIHSKGLKFGIHVMRGIPRQACNEKSPVLNSTFTASQIANSRDTCNWMNHMFGLDMSRPGSQEYLNSLLTLYASWDVDFIKIDDLSSPYHKAEIEGYRKARDICKRNIIISTSPGETPLSEATHISENANLWRLLGDLWDDWKAVDHAFDVIERWNNVRKPGQWPDPDMLPLGKLSKYGPVGPERYCRLTVSEQCSLMTLWCISASPLMLGGNLPENDSITLKLITNETAIDANQHTSNNHAIINGKNPVWFAKSINSQDAFLAFFNRDSVPHDVNFKLAQTGIKDCELYDIWAKKRIPTRKANIECSLKPHSSVFYRLINIIKM